MQSRTPIEHLIADALTTSPSPEPGDVVEHVIGQIDPTLYIDYLRDLIRSRLSTVVSRQRNREMPKGVRRGLSTKQSLIRDEWWPRFLAQRIVVADGSHKFLRDATVGDLRFLAAKRTRQAEELSQRSAEFTRLANLMEAEGVKTLGDLSSAPQMVTS